mmetsp:Transcript_9846/g.16556  ORF Transcript_9846/g.16556 Transcript_9846/m.16556 type:complete len:124 (-) Transcript_9846:85-456(-)
MGAKVPEGSGLILLVLLIIALVWSLVFFSWYTRGLWLILPICGLIAIICGLIGVIIHNELLLKICTICALIVTIGIIVVFIIYVIQVMACNGCRVNAWHIIWFIGYLLLWGAITFFSKSTAGI